MNILPFPSRGQPSASRRFTEAELMARLKELAGRGGAAKIFSLALNEPSQVGISLNHTQPTLCLTISIFTGAHGIIPVYGMTELKRDR